MGLFRPYQRDNADQTEATSPDTATQQHPAGQRKGAPTPSRREAEQLRREQMRPTLSKKERRARERELTRVRQEQSWAKVEQYPERVLLRNFVDARWTFSEFVWPVMMLCFAVFIAGIWYPPLTFYVSYLIWAVFGGIVLESTFLWFMFRRLLNDRMPGVSRRGLLMYMTSRMISMRRFRRPPTAVDRGAAI